LFSSIQFHLKHFSNYRHIHIPKSINAYSIIHSKNFIKPNINFEKVARFIEKVVLKFHKNSLWPTCSNLTITQVLKIILESNQRHRKVTSIPTRLRPILHGSIPNFISNSRAKMKSKKKSNLTYSNFTFIQNHHNQQQQPNLSTLNLWIDIINNTQ